MEIYKQIVQNVLINGIKKKNRTGVDTIAIPGVMFEHNMSDGFPLLTTKHIPFHLVASELEFFIKGITDKKWLQDRNNYIWSEWCRPDRVPYGHDFETKQHMLESRDLGPIYGSQWCNFGAGYTDAWNPPVLNGINQLEMLLGTLKTNPDSRRMLVSAWNPADLDKMALPPCHYAFQVTVIDNKLNLLWNQRSVDVALGLPFNIASYGLLLHLLCYESGFEPGKLVGFLADTHIYENHIDGLKTQLRRKPYDLPSLEIESFTSIFEWEYADVVVKDYVHHNSIPFDIAV